MATRVAESWLKDFLPTSAVPNTAAPVLDKMCTHSGNVLDCVVRNVQGHEGQLAGTDQEGIQNGMFRMTNPWWRSPRARSLDCEQQQRIILRRDNAAYLSYDTEAASMDASLTIFRRADWPPSATTVLATHRHWYARGLRKADRGEQLEANRGEHLVTSMPRAFFT